MTIARRSGFALATALLLLRPVLAGQPTPAPAPSPSASARAAAFDAVAATDAYLARVPAADRARIDRYFEGGYWLLLWDFLIALAVNLGLLASGVSARMRRFAERLSRFRPLQTFLYVAAYLVVTSLVVFPMTVYEGFFRERAYGLMNQGLGSWLKDQTVGLGVGILFGGLSAVVLYGVVRRMPRTWATWGAVAAILLSILGILLAPVYVFPLFNTYTRLSDQVVKPAILDLARSEGVPARDVFVYDASRQTKRVSANVSGFASTMRISLNDNLLNRSSLAEIEAVMGHEIGHYVLHHIYKTTIFVSIVIAVGFAFLRWAGERLLARHGNAWGARDIGDTAALPLVVILLSAYFFVLTPVLNSYTRVEEAEADLFGINASGQPDGEALADLKLGEYRKLDPTPLEELVFFDHPSGRSRILMAMRWKAEHLSEAEANARRAHELDSARGWSEETARTWAKAHEPR